MTKEERKKIINEYFQLCMILSDDCVAVGKNYESNRSQLNRRTFIRTFFSYVEGEIFQLKQLCLMMNQEKLVNYNRAELALLRDEQYDLKDGGNVRIGSKFLKIQSNLRFAVKSFDKAFNPPHKIVFEGDGWKSFLEGKKIRNRVIHPKNQYESNINNEEMRTVKKGVNWYNSNMKNLIEGLEKYDK